MNVAIELIKVRARRAARHRIRSVRMKRHLIAAAVAALIAFAVSPLMTTPLGFFAIALLVGFSLNSIARGVDARFGHFWGWLYPEPRRLTRCDRFVDRLVRPPAVALPDRPELKVRPLDPWE